MDINLDGKNESVQRFRYGSYVELNDCMENDSKRWVAFTSSPESLKLTPKYAICEWWGMIVCIRVASQLGRFYDLNE